MTATFEPDYRSESDFPDNVNDLSEAERCRLSNERTRLLHIYGQFVWHSPADIIGNSNALKVLRDAINVALETGRGQTYAMTADGEGFCIGVECDDRPWEHKAWTTRQMPYVDPMARGEPDLKHDVIRLQIALRQANAELVKRGVKPVIDPLSVMK